MSASIKTTDSDRRKRVLRVAANPSVSEQTGWPIGIWWSELTHPNLVFTEAGYEVESRSPDGGRLVADSLSEPEHESGYSAADFGLLGCKHSPQHAALLEDTDSIEDVDPDEYDAVVLIGGRAPMYTLVEHPAVQQLVVGTFESGKVTALAFHETAVLLKARLSSGDLLVRGRTCFADAEEDTADEYVGQRIQPFWIETEARKLEASHFIVDHSFRLFAVRDGKLVTGQQLASGAETVGRARHHRLHRRGGGPQPGRHPGHPLGCGTGGPVGGRRLRGLPPARRHRSDRTGTDADPQRR